MIADDPKAPIAFGGGFRSTFGLDCTPLWSGALPLGTGDGVGSRAGVDSAAVRQSEGVEAHPSEDQMAEASYWKRGEQE